MSENGRELHNGCYSLAEVEQAVARERAAWATKVTALADDWESWTPSHWDEPAAELRALLAADDTEAQS